MRPKPLVLRLLVPSVLVGLVAWLAALEYRWLDQVSQADREQRRASLEQRAQEFADDFDRELSRLYVFLQTASPSVETGADAAFATRYDAWRETARDPQMLRAIYWARAGTHGPTLAEYRPDTHTFTQVPWPAALAPIEADFGPRQEAAGVAIPAAPGPLARDPVDASVPAIVVQNLPTRLIRSELNVNTFVSLTVSPDRLIAYLDRPYLQSTVLPALAARYFPTRGVDPYRLAVIDVRNPRTPVMTSDWPPGAAVDPKQADTSVPLFALRSDLTTQILQRTAMNDVPGAAASLGTVSRLSGSLEASTAGAVGPIPPGVAAPTQTGAAAPNPAGAAAPGPRTGQATFRLVLDAHGPASSSASAVRFVSRSTSAGWQLVLQHSSGSLDVAVNRARRRNLWLSFGLLAVLAAGVVLIVTNAQRSERLATQQMDFVATVSHELRTPLAVIRSAAQNLSAGVVDDPARAKQYGELIEGEGRRLTEMVEQVLDYAGISGAQRPTSARLVDVGAVAADVLASCQPLAALAHVDLESDIQVPLPPVLGDEQALRSAIQNLVTNALKYGADGHWLRLEVRTLMTRGRTDLQVSVSDRGLGVDAADRPHLFDPFFRGRRALDAQVRGNGLGLSLVKRIAESHGGQVDVESAPGSGATFRIVVPAARITTAGTADVEASLDAGAFGA
jgi:two-component system sensor histidine kinase SenX3